MTTADVIAHWRKGAHDALEAAKLLEKDGKYDLALFHCHLAVEKALKAAIMEKTKKPHPKIHSLWNLATLLSGNWSICDKEIFITLSDFAIAARYDDPRWAERFATAKNAGRWTKRTEKFLTTFLP
jgi:HEPN domain-containing protein